MPDEDQEQVKIEPRFFEAHGLRCCIQRNNLAAWCGYVIVPLGHPLHGKSVWDDDFDADLRVHGGVNWSKDHLPWESTESTWVFGFDCSHLLHDLVPGLIPIQRRITAMDSSARMGLGAPSYKNAQYVEAATRDLARQVAEYAAGLEKGNP